MLNLQSCGGGKRLIFCNGVQRYNVFLNWKNFFCLFSKNHLKINEQGHSWIAGALVVAVWLTVTVI